MSVRVLVVDDERNLVNLLRGYLEREGFGVYEALDGVTARVEAHLGRLVFDFVADNPGEWFFHCHNAYHMETGMARVVSQVG